MDAEIKTILADFFDSYPKRKYVSGNTFIWANDDPPGIIYLESGNVSQYSIGENGQKVILNIYKPKAFFPMSWAINKTPNKYFFEAASDVECRIAPSEEVLKFVKQQPKVVLDLLSRLYKGVDGLLMRMTELSVGNARSQLLLELMISAHRFGKLNQDGSAEVNIKVTELGHRTGMARETVSRELAHLVAEGLVQKRGGQLYIPKVEALTAD